MTFRRRNRLQSHASTMAFCRQCRCRQGLVSIAIIALFIPLATCFTVKRSNLPNSKRGRRQHHEMITGKARAPSLRHQSAASEGDDTTGNTVNPYNRYMNLLESHPLVTKSISSGIVSALGDVLAQWIEALSGQLPFTLNMKRLLSFFVCNTLFVGPFLHFWWGQLEQMGTWMDTKFNASKRLQTLTKVVLDQTVGVAVFFPAYFYAYELTEALVSWRGVCIGCYFDLCCLCTVILFGCCNTRWSHLLCFSQRQSWQRLKPSALKS